MPKGIPLTQGELARRRHEIFEAAVHLFLEKASTRLRWSRSPELPGSVNQPV